MKWALSRKNLWNKMPRTVKGVVGRVLRVVPMSVLLGRAFRRQSRFLLRAQWWPRQRAEAHQLERMRQIVTLAYDKTTFYRRAFDSVGFDPGEFRTLADLRRVPLIDKQTILDNTDQMCARDANAAGVDCISTGGTGGVPLRFHMPSSRSSVEYAYLVACWGRAGFSLGDAMAIFRGKAVAPDRAGLFHEYDPLLRHHYYSSFHMSTPDLRRCVKHLVGIGPCFLHAYPSSATALANFLLGAGLEAPSNVRGVLLESEIVYPQQRKMLEEVFGTRAFSSYGHSEKLILACGCEHSDDYHVWPTYGYFELLDDQGDSVRTPGQRGEIVGTGFINTVMPFIRYRTGDFATYVGDRCEACGREHTIIREIRGHRTQEVLIARDGSEISWTALNMHDDTFLRVRQFQFRQDAPGKAVLRIVPAEGYGQEDRERIVENLGRKLAGRVDFVVEPVDRIERTSRGKAIYVDQRIATSARREEGLAAKEPLR